MTERKPGVRPDVIAAALTQSIVLSDAVEIRLAVGEDSAAEKRRLNRERVAKESGVDYPHQWQVREHTNALNRGRKALLREKLP